MCPTDAGLTVLWNQRLSLREGGSDSAETDDDRSALPLMCTYQPIGELCHRRDLCLNSPPPPAPPCATISITSSTLCSNTFSASAMQRSGPRYLSLPRSPFFLRGERRIYLWEEFESVIFSHSLSCRSPAGRLYCIFMNYPVY